MTVVQRSRLKPEGNESVTVTGHSQVLTKGGSYLLKESHKGVAQH